MAESMKIFLVKTEITPAWFTLQNSVELSADEIELLKILLRNDIENLTIRKEFPSMRTELLKSDKALLKKLESL